ncbi:hypothetical protein ACLBKS_03045 [Hylemonella sp. W303a]|uniref:hypothetical protein n=1 Tax=Hylemonella sp. W303a TaxID=3389873 RepID=UPI00396B25AE
MPQWDLKATRDLLKARYGPAQLACVADPLRAITVRFAHAGYHFAEVRRLLTENIDAKLPSVNIYELTFPGTKGWSDLQEGLVKVEAHMIACAQAIHSVPDALAHVAYFAAGLNIPVHKLGEHVIGLKSLLKSSLLVGRGFASVHDSLDQLRQDPAFAILDALVNYGKHRGLPDPVLEVDPEGRAEPYAMHFAPFEYRDRHHALTEVEKLLSPAYSAVNSTVIRTGQLIHAALQ